MRTKPLGPYAWLARLWLDPEPGACTRREVNVYLPCVCHLALKPLAFKSRVPAIWLPIRQMVRAQGAVRVGRIRNWGALPLSALSMLLVLRDQWLETHAEPPTCKGEPSPDQQGIDFGLFG